MAKTGQVLEGLKVCLARIDFHQAGVESVRRVVRLDALARGLPHCPYSIRVSAQAPDGFDERVVVARRE